MYVLDNDALPKAALPGIEHTTLACAQNGLSRLSVWSQTVAPGGATPPHRHDCEEVVVIVSGRGELRVRDEVFAFGANATLVVPQDVEHQILNTGDEPLKVLAAFSATPVEVVLPDGTPLRLPWPS
jgi:mannose-6-phosphate isomerase-like protein (cupin superfamily)